MAKKMADRILGVQEEMDQLESATLALEAGTFLTDPMYCDDDLRVLERTAMVRDWLIAGPGTHADLLARRRAVRQLMTNLGNAANATRTPPDRNAHRFLDSAEKYYQALLSP
jgi:hypothetical protein